MHWFCDFSKVPGKIHGKHRQFVKRSGNRACNRTCILHTVTHLSISIYPSSTRHLFGIESNWKKVGFVYVTECVTVFFLSEGGDWKFGEQWNGCLIFKLHTDK